MWLMPNHLAISYKNTYKESVETVISYMVTYGVSPLSEDTVRTHTII